MTLVIQRSADGVSGWADISGTTDVASYIVAAGDATYYLRVKETKGGVTAYSTVIGPITSGSSSNVYWGARINGQIYLDHYSAATGGYAPWCTINAYPNSWDNFELHAGKQVSAIQWGGNDSLGLTFAFDTTASSRCHSRGAFSQYDLGPTYQQLVDLAANSDANGAITAATTLADAIGGQNYPVMFRPMWEMNGSWGWAWQPASISSATYVAAWRKLHDIFAIHAPAASFFWCPNVIGSEPDPTPWYPGDAYVDWVGYDGYNQGANVSPSAIFDATHTIVRGLAPSKPVGIGETGCKAPTSYTGGKSQWVTDYFSWLAGKPEIKYFNWYNDGGYTYDYFIEVGDTASDYSGAAQAAFAAGISNSRYLAQAANGFINGQKIPIP
jgi:Glycosyl hydrolase family 26